MWQVMLVFLFAAGLAWLVAQSAPLPQRPPSDEDWAGWLAELERRHRAGR